jgi:hypothetical protein
LLHFILGRRHCIFPRLPHVLRTPLLSQPASLKSKITSSTPPPCPAHRPPCG